MKRSLQMSAKKKNWIPVKVELSLTVQWVPLAENFLDGITREDVNNDVRLSERVFRRVDVWYGPTAK